MMKKVSILLTIIGLIANILGMLNFFGIKGENWLQGVIQNPIWFVVSLSVLIIGVLLFILSKRNEKYDIIVDENEQIIKRLEISNYNVRVLLDTLYRNTHFSLKRYEREYNVINKKGDVLLRKNYILKAHKPINEMWCYVEARIEDDLESVFNELVNSCTGGIIKDNYRRLTSQKEGVVVLGFLVEFEVPIHNKEHTLAMQCSLNDYFYNNTIHEFVHMALPTERSIIKFKFDYPVKFLKLGTISVDSLGENNNELGNEHFSYPSNNEIKWEISDPDFGSFYDVSFEVIKL